MSKILAIASLLFFVSTVNAARIAVTDLTYNQEVEGYIHIVDYHNRSSVNASSSGAVAVGPYSAMASSRENLNASSKTDYFEYEHNYKYIEYGELHKFTGDIRGEIVKSGHFQVIQAKPVTEIKSEKIYDIIGRIKKGYYPGADFVLFGTLSDISFSDDVYTPQGSGRAMQTESFNLTLTAEFSLINTKTYQIIASFSAMGDGADTKVQSSGTYAKPNRARVVAEASKTLGQDVIKQLEEQVYPSLESEDKSHYQPNHNPADGPAEQAGRGVFVFQ